MSLWTRIGSLVVAGVLSTGIVSAKEAHEHGAGHAHTSPHGGVVETIGSYHAELVFNAATGTMELYVLGEDESKAQPINASTLTVQAKAEGSSEFIAIPLTAAPLAGEKDGASRFTGTADALKGAKGFEAAVQIPVGGKKLRAKFNWKGGAASGGHGHDHGAHGHAHVHAESGPATISSSAVALQPLEIGKASTLELTLKDAAGALVTVEKLVEAHTEKVHLLIVDPSLSDYQHIHPKPSDRPGVYVFPFTPTSGGKYLVFADLLPIATKRQEYSIATLDVPGAVKTIDTGANMETTLAGLTFRLEFDKPTLKAGEALSAKVMVTSADGKPFDQLEPIMGAFAHAVAFDETRASVLHIHPEGKEPEKPTERGGPVMEFHTKFAKAGFWKLYVQVQVNGKDVFAPFGLKVEPGTEKVATSRVNNALCPITGEAVHSMVANGHLVFNGVRVELCCPGCEVKFLKNPETLLKKAQEGPKLTQ